MSRQKWWSKTTFKTDVGLARLSGQFGLRQCSSRVVSDVLVYKQPARFIDITYISYSILISFK